MATKVEKKDCEETNMGFTCEICIEASIPTQRFRHNHSCDNICLNDCDPNICHANCAPNICLTCLASHIQVKVDENIATIRCPSCRKTLNPVECQPLIPAEIFVKWCDCRCRSSVSSSESRYCPNRTCSELILNDCDDMTKKCACPQCKTLMCFECRVPWHAGFRCSESSQGWDSDDQELGFLMEQKKWTRCPGCGQPTDRLDGCPLLQCRCGTSFCHNCGDTASLLHACDQETRRNRNCLYFVIFLLFPLIYLFIDNFWGLKSTIFSFSVVLFFPFVGHFSLWVLRRGEQWGLDLTPYLL